jgi:hypothetical protein
MRLIYLAPVLAIVALLAWTLASPMGSSPDDDYHLNSIWCANALKADHCTDGAEPNTKVVLELTLFSSCYAQVPENSAECLYQYLDNADASEQTSRGNFLGQYPPVYYSVMSLFVFDDVQESIYLMRVFNVLLFVGITLALGLLLPVSRRPVLIGGWIIATVPLAAFLIASNNPSAWAIIGVPSAWIALVGFFETTGRRRIALGAIFALAVIMAAGSRTDAAVYTLLGSALAVWMTFRKDRGYLLSLILPAVLAVVAIVFYATSGQASVATGGLAATGSGTGDHSATDPTGSHAPRDLFGLIAYNLLQMPTLWVGNFGLAGLGWLDTTMPAVVWTGSAAVFAVVVFTGLRNITWRKGIAVVGVVLVLWLLPAYVLVRGGNVVGENVQPRYILPLVIILGMLAILPVGARMLRLNWFQLAIIGTALVIANSFALHTNIRRYVTGIDVATANLDKGAEWWWPVGPSPMATWIIGTLAYAGLLAVLAWEVKRRGILGDQRTLA